MTLPSQAVTRTADDAETVALLGGVYRYRAIGADTADAYSLFEVTGEPGFAAPIHAHTREGEGFFVAQGQVTLFLAERQVTLVQGGFALAPPEMAHAFRFDGPNTRLVLLITPGNAGHEALFRDLADVSSEGKPPDFALLGRVAARHGTRIVGPPPPPE